jgi:HAD superfamily hydrolase (TIGR01484 family)
MNHMIEGKPYLIERLRHVEIIYTDLDGTLFGPGGSLLLDGEGRPGTRTAEALVAVTEAGIPVVPTTGRSDFQLIEVVRICGLNDFIAESGAIISWWTGTDREEEFILPQWDETILKGRTPYEVMQDAGAADLLFERFAGQLEHHEPWHEPRRATEVLRGRIDLMEAQAVLDTLDVSLEITENGAINPKRHTLEDTLCRDSHQIHAYHIVPKGVDKAIAIAADLRRRGIDAKIAVMIGDGMSDLLCAPSVGVALMVENARQSPSVNSLIETFENAAFVAGKRGDGWINMASLILQGTLDSP